MLAAKLLAGGGAETLYAEDVFSAYTYTGNGSTQTITNGIDLAGKGGLVWIKQRNQASSHRLFDTSRGVHNSLASNATAATASFSGYLTAFNSNGFSVGTGNDVNESGYPLVSWTFRNADKFYNHTTVTKTAGSNATVSFSNLTTLGMVRVKRTDAAGSWYIWHRSLSAGKLLIGETTAAEATLGHITVSGTTITLVNGVIADGTYLVEGFAHDTSADGLIQCGSFTTDASGNATVNLGWEPQFVTIKRTDSTGYWITQDSARGLLASDTVGARLYPNASLPEDTSASVRPSATGFSTAPAGVGVSTTYIYLAIRRPNKPPTTGTQVYNAIARTGTGAAATVTGVGFAPDLVHIKRRTAVDNNFFGDRLRGPVQALYSDATVAEAAFSNGVTSFSMDGMSLGTGTAVNATDTLINHFFKRAPGVFDVVCYTGTAGAWNIAHNLGVAPELCIFKLRSAAGGEWVTHFGFTSTNMSRAYVDTTGAAANDTYTNFGAGSISGQPTATAIPIASGAGEINTNAATYVLYLFATLAGISKVFSYTGNGGTAGSAGTSQTINCGFATGARFVMLKCTSHASNWVVVDTTRGLVAGNDPALSLNTTAAEVTTTDLLDPDTTGFVVNQLATGTTSADFNVTGRTYIGLAFS